jgi:hypothetical protein
VDGRVFLPDMVACRGVVLETNGNRIRYIGAYGNMDSRGTGSAEPNPEIAFASMRMVAAAATSRRIRVADQGNGRVSVISLDHGEQRSVPLLLEAR